MVTTHLHLERQMKKLKRRLSAAFRGGGSQQNVELCGANGLTNGVHHISPSYGLFAAATPNRAWSLSDSMNHLADSRVTIKLTEHWRNEKNLNDIESGFIMDDRYSKNEESLTEKI
ncbi:unnamed protein product [Strongylus vulgaris]|uniref:Uncharacterized protein n=1 Tax=Strongylus vulgaris TaxID=40348 RepID=A0A3P7JBZ1_STRVU|nr:unnamed protein product [Strongylus vulgaris]